MPNDSEKVSAKSNKPIKASKNWARLQIDIFIVSTLALCVPIPVPGIENP